MSAKDYSFSFRLKVVQEALKPENRNSISYIAEKHGVNAKVLSRWIQRYNQYGEEGLKTSIGGHILVGLRAKLPIIPIAAYANFKYYFGGDFPEEIEPGRMAAEIGVGLAI